MGGLLYKVQRYDLFQNTNGRLICVRIMKKDYYSMVGGLLLFD